MRDRIKYLGIVIALWLLAYCAAKLFSASWLTCALLVGAVAANVLPFAAGAGKHFSRLETFFLGFSIALMGFQLDFSALAILSPATMSLLTAIVVGTIMLAIFLGSKLRLSPAMSIFIGVGSAICGSAAIAAASSFFPDERDREEAGISLGVINFVGLIGLGLLPLLVKAFDLGPLAAGLLIGGSLQSLGHVVAAGFALGPNIGTYAALVKMGRVVFIAPVLLALGLWTGRGARSKWHLLPSYIYGHIIALVLANTVTLPADLLQGFKVSFDLLLGLAMVCIGLKIRVNLIREGAKALALSVFLFALLLGCLLVSNYVG